MLYNEMAIKQTFGGRSQKITPEFIVATKLKILTKETQFSGGYFTKMAQK